MSEPAERASMSEPLERVSLRAWAARGWARWTQWLDVTLPLWPLTVFRFVLGMTVWWESGHNKARFLQYTPGQLHLPVVPFARGFEPSVYELICDIQGWAGLALAIGLVPRAAALVAFAMQGALFSVSLLNFRNHIYLTLTYLALIATTPIHRGWGVMAFGRWMIRWFRNEPTPPEERITRATGWRMIQVTTISVYFWATFHKVISGFHTGYVLANDLPRNIRAGIVPRWLEENALEWHTWLMAFVSDMNAMKWASYGTLVVEGGIAIGFLFRRTRIVAALLGIGLHLGIALTMNIFSFGTLLVGTYVLFFFDRPVHPTPSDPSDPSNPSDPRDVQHALAPDGADVPSDASQGPGTDEHGGSSSTASSPNTDDPGGTERAKSPTKKKSGRGGRGSSRRSRGNA